MTIYLGRALPRASSDLPADDSAPGSGLSAYLVLLPVGFTLPLGSPRNAVRSYRTISPLPEAIFPALKSMRVGRIAPAVSFLLHFPSDYSALMLSSTVPWKMPV